MFGCDLGTQRHREECKKNQSTDRVTQVQLHGQCITTSLAKGRGEDFDYPESNCDPRDFAEGIVIVVDISR